MSVAYFLRKIRQRYKFLKFTYTNLKQLFNQLVVILLKLQVIVLN